MQLKWLNIWQRIQAEKLFAKQEQNTHLACTCRAYLRPQDAIFTHIVIYLGQFECSLFNWKGQMTSQQESDRSKFLQFACLSVNLVGFPKCQVSWERQKWVLKESVVPSFVLSNQMIYGLYLPNIDTHFLNCSVLRINEISHSRSRNLYQIYLCLTVWIRSMHGLSGYSNLQRYFMHKKRQGMIHSGTVHVKKGMKICFCIVGGS